MHTLGSLRADNERLWQTMTIDPRRRPAIEVQAKRAIKLKSTFVRIEALTGVPWFLIVALDYREADLDLKCHLHNGDPLSNWTKNDPPHRPGKGSPPFTFIESALDALAYDKLTDNRDWSIAGIAYYAEKFNGFGYRNTGHVSPYVWGWSNHASKGKYVKDHVYDPNAVEKECGIMPLIRVMMDLDASIQVGKLIETRKPTIIDAATMTNPVATKIIVGAVSTPAVAYVAGGVVPTWAIIGFGAVAACGLLWAIWATLNHHATLQDRVE